VGVLYETPIVLPVQWIETYYNEMQMSVF